MVRAIWRLGLTTALAGALVGCSHNMMTQRKPPPPDPLLVSRKPIEGKPRPADADVTARLQPPTGDLLAPAFDAPPTVQAAGHRSGE